MIAAALAGHQAEAAAGEGTGRTGAAKMDEGGQVLPLLQARRRAGPAGSTA